jgi:K+-sensing histidine kinase KdpD
MAGAGSRILGETGLIDKEARSKTLEGWSEQWRERRASLSETFDEAIEWIWRRASNLHASLLRRPVLFRWTLVVVSVLLAAAVGGLVRDVVGQAGLILFLPAVMVSALYGGLAAGAAASVLGAIVSVRLFMRPAHVEQVWTIENGVTLLFYFIACAMMLGFSRLYDLQKNEVVELASNLEEHVAERTAELQAANRELSAICYSISHDLRAPMRNIVGASQTIVEDYGDRLEGEAHERLMSIAASANRMGRLVDDLLSHTRIGHIVLKREWVDFTALADEVVAQVDSDLWKFSRLEPRITPGMVATADKTLLRAALFHLVDNACKFAKEGETLRIEVGEEKQRGRRCFWVRDNGVGFEMKFAHKVFEPFQRLHRDSDVPGTGIGLANVKRIIQRHGGDVWLQSEPSQGTTMYFTLGERMEEVPSVPA